MKKLSITVFGALCLFFSNATKAQSQIKVGVGDSSFAETTLNIEDSIVDIFGSIFGLQATHDTSTKVPYVFVDYRQSLSEVISVGGQVGYTNIESKTSYNNGDSRKASFGIFTVMPGVDVRYFQSGKFKFYGNANLGVAFVNGKSESNGVASEDDNYTAFIFQVNPVGVSYGGNVSAFLEAGFGLSLINAGLKFTL